LQLWNHLQCLIPSIQSPQRRTFHCLKRSQILILKKTREYVCGYLPLSAVLWSSRFSSAVMCFDHGMNRI
ncbi:hypothetical protein NDU88_009998, partial [Pleurodeles waltl]